MEDVRRAQGPARQAGSEPNKWQAEFARLNTARADWPDERRWLENGFLRPPLIQILDCKNLSISDVTIKNPPFWTINPVYCDGVNGPRHHASTTRRTRPTPTASIPSRRATCTSPTAHMSTGDDCIAHQVRPRRAGAQGRPSRRELHDHELHDGARSRRRLDRQRDGGRRAAASRSRTASSRAPSAASGSRRRAGAAASSRTCASATSSFTT